MKNAVHMLKSVTNIQMNSFLITTESGKVIAIDGGHRQDARYFIDYLQEVTGASVPHLDAWFLTHPHNDHVDAFLEVMENHSDEIAVERVYFNFPSVHFLARESEETAKTLMEFYACLPRFADKIRFCSGYDRFDIGEAHFDILYSHDFEINTDVCNNASLVFRMSLGGKVVLFTGDCGEKAGQKIVRIWKDTGMLKADICQMSHHGQDGCDREFYEAVAPETCLWCTPRWLWDNDMGDGFNTYIFETVTVRGWMDEIGARRHLVMKDGTQVCEV